jgi:hypothetical protein
VATTTYLRKAMLDWCLGGAAATQPSARFISWATGSPNTDGASDGPFSVNGVGARKTCTFAAANSPQGSCTNVAAISGGTATAIATILGWNLWDAAAAGNRLAFGTMTVSVGCASGDIISVAAGALKITLV